MVKLSSFPQPTEGIRFEQNNTAAHLNSTNLGKGTIYIAESKLSWIRASGDGFSVDYPHISLHAISRDLNAFPEECLFLMLDIAIGGHQENVEFYDSDFDITTELRFVPEDKGVLEMMFHALSACQALHPDPDDSLSDEDFYEDADEDISVDETNARLADLCIEPNNAFGMVASREEGMVEDMGVDTAADMVEEEDTVCSEAEDREVDTAADMVEAHIQSSFEYRRIYSYHQDQADSCSDTGCFDDVES